MQKLSAMKAIYDLYTLNAPCVHSIYIYIGSQLHGFSSKIFILGLSCWQNGELIGAKTESHACRLGARTQISWEEKLFWQSRAAVFSQVSQNTVTLKKRLIILIILISIHVLFLPIWLLSVDVTNKSSSFLFLQSSLDEHAVEVVVVSFGCQEGASHWLQETGCQYDMLLDPDRKVRGRHNDPEHAHSDGTPALLPVADVRSLWSGSVSEESIKLW